MKKYYILVSVDFPTDDTHRSNLTISGFVSKTQKIDNKEGGIRRLHENTWLLERENAASSLAKIVSASEVHGFEYEVLYLSSDE
ncbi:MAG TPA: hypothetical protein PLA50_12625 [Bacteroidia bacterium]|nr:hypothetical protein [Bacteroidia bacterium]